MRGEPQPFTDLEGAATLSKDMTATDCSDETEPLNGAKKRDSNEQDLSLARRIAVIAVVAILAAFEGVCMSLPGPFFPPEAKKHGNRLETPESPV